jgi:hypothetical protein
VKVGDLVRIKIEGQGLTEMNGAYAIVMETYRHVPTYGSSQPAANVLLMTRRFAGRKLPVYGRNLEVVDAK